MTGVPSGDKVSEPSDLPMIIANRILNTVRYAIGNRVAAEVFRRNDSP